MVKTRHITWSLVLIVCASAARAHAQDEKIFAKGSKWFDLSLREGLGVDGDWASAPSASVEAGYFVLPNLSLGAEATGYYITQPGDNAAAVQIAGVMRHHFLQWDTNTAFADISFGPFEASNDVPADGTRFNFVTRFGLGLTHKMQNDSILMGGIRYWHLSNARIEGREHNPSINGIEFFVGLGWSW